MRTAITNRFFTPVLTPFMESRTLAFTIVGCAVLQTALVFFGLPSWQCPIRATTGIPCPGCGLSTATSLLFKGRWQESLQTHAFAPVFLLAFVLIAVVNFLPQTQRQNILHIFNKLESQTGFATIIIMAFVGYWGVRFILTI